MIFNSKMPLYSLHGEIQKSLYRSFWFLLFFTAKFHSLSSSVIFHECVLQNRSHELHQPSWVVVGDAKPKGAARTFLLDPQGLQYSMRFAWIVHDQCEICWMEIPMCVILAQGPCMDMSSVVKLSDSSLQMWSHCFHLHLLARLLRIKLHWKIPFGFLLS